MLKKNKFNIKFSKLVLPITKRIESFFNLLDYFNKNKKKYLNSWQKSVDKKIFFSSISAVIIVIGYFLLPAFYDQAKIKDQLKDQILQEYNFEVQLDENFEYGLFPKPHFFIKDLEIKNDSKSISTSKYTKIYISSKNNFEFNKIKIKNLSFLETEFRIDKSNINFFSNLLKNESINKNIKFTRNKLFYLDENENMIFFSELSKLNYLYQENLLNKLTAKIEIFNLPLSLKANYDTVKKIFFTKLDIDSLKLNIVNNSTFKTNLLDGELNINYLNKDLRFKYNLKDKNLNFNTANQKFSGEINIKPFFLKSNINLENINMKEILKDDSLAINLLKSEILNNKNFNGRIDIVIDGLNDLNHIDRIKFDIKFEEGEIFLSNLNFVFKNSVTFNINNVSFILDENDLKFIGSINIGFKNMQNFYSHFQIIRNYRKNIDKITSNFIFNFDEKLFEFNELKISGIDKQVSDQYLRKFNSEKKDLFNKVIMRNTVKDFFKTISLD